MPTGTPNLETIKRAVSREFPDAIYGQFNCRRRNALRYWSQHAGSEPAFGYKGNAIDIVHKDHGYGDETPKHQAWLDLVNAFLVANRVALNLNELIWRKRNHYDHIHTSPFPKMYDLPWYKAPCDGGSTLIVVYRDGTRGSTFGLPGPLPPPTLEENMIRPGDTGASVVHIQEALIAWDGAQILEPDGVDGVYGVDTTAAVVKFQRDKLRLDETADGVTGVVDGFTAARLEWYHLIKYGVHALDQPSDPQEPAPHEHPDYAGKQHLHAIAPAHVHNVTGETVD